MPEDGAGPHPTIVYTHGGPTSVHQPVFSRLCQAWADEGFALEPFHRYETRVAITLEIEYPHDVVVLEGFAGVRLSLKRRDALGVVGQGLAESVGVLEEDVDPDPWICAGYAGHIAQRAGGGRQRLVAVDTRHAGLV